MTDWRSFPTGLADRCVMCAQCLPHCPTWRLARVEAESPRGRIALMQGLAAGTIEADDATLTHLDHCLDCRQCESVCPAEVPYGALHDAAQAALGGPRRTRGIVSGLLRAWSKRPDAFGGVAGAAIRFWARSPLRRAFMKWMPARLRALDALLPDHAPPPPAAGVTGEGRRVQLFLGCIARAVDSVTLNAAVEALQVAGCRVEVPAGQGCCGALHQHAGDSETARQLALRNILAFDGGQPVITCASGCAATLLDYPDIAGEAGAVFSARVVDVMQFLKSSGIAPVAVQGRTTLHTPCTLHAVQHSARAPAELLPDARVLPHAGRCCGAAGEYLLTQPKIAASLRDGMLDEIGEPDTLCTSNPGCAMHLRAGLHARGAGTVVHHPVVEWLRCR